MDYFEGITTARGAHNRYRALALKWHPDRCADDRAGAIMAAINHDYKECLKCIEGARGTAAVASEPARPVSVVKRPAKRTRKAEPKTGPDVERIIDKGGALLTDICTTAIERGVAWVKTRLHEP